MPTEFAPKPLPDSRAWLVARQIANNMATVRSSSIGSKFALDMLTVLGSPSYSRVENESAELTTNYQLPTTATEGSPHAS